MSHRLPLFPLDVVLFPGAPLPLHIFEPRYRQLLADCLEGDHRFGIMPVGDEATRPEPGVGAVGCTAEIRAHQQLDDGRSNIVVIGTSRFAVDRLVDTTSPYLIALVDDFHDLDDTEPPHDAVNKLRELFTRYVDALRELNDLAGDEPSLDADIESLSFQVAAAVRCGVPIKQRMLTTRSTADRVSTLLRILPALTTETEASLRVHDRARGNGRGGTGSDIVTGE